MMIGMGMPTSQSRMPRMGVLRDVASGSERRSRPCAPAATAHHRLVSGRPSGPARRAALLRGIGAAAALLGGAGCTIDPVGNYLGGIGDPVRGAALYAPSTIGDTSRWTGRPEQAALAAEQVEFLASEMRSNPRYAPEVNPAVTQ